MAVSGVMAQGSNIQWAKCLGGYLDDGANSIMQTSDSGYIVAGNTYSKDVFVPVNHGVGDFWLAKLYANGFIQWQKSLGGSESDIAYSIQQTNDGGYIIAGKSSSNDFDISGGHHGNWNSDAWIVKITSNGTLQWQRSLGGTKDEEARAILQTDDGGYIVAGTAMSIDGDLSGTAVVEDIDYWVVKLGVSGAIQWQKRLGGSMPDYATSIQKTTDGGYIVAGYSGSHDGDVTGNHGGTDYWIVKINSIGTILWQQSLGGTGNEEAYAIQQTKDGGYIVGGCSPSNDGDVTGHHDTVYYNLDYWIVKLDVSGILEWQKSLGGINNEVANSIQQTHEGGYIIAGYSASKDGDVTGHHDNPSSSYVNDSWVVKLDTSGNLLWQKSLGGTNNDGASSIYVTNDRGYIVAGWTESIDGDIAGKIGGSGTNDVWVVKLTQDPTGVDEIPTISISISPNPTTGIITIKGISQPTVEVYNLMGQKLVAAQNTNEVSLANLPMGLYLVQVYSKDMELVKSEKVILQK